MLGAPYGTWGVCSSGRYPASTEMFTGISEWNKGGTQCSGDSREKREKMEERDRDSEGQRLRGTGTQKDRDSDLIVGVVGLLLR